MRKEISCFVIMPIGDEEKDPIKFKHFLGVYEGIIKPSVESICREIGIEIRCTRADDIKKSGSIMKQVLQMLFDAEILIADLSGQNPNVFYELGIRHTFFKRAILISNSPADNPFDVYGYRTIPYQHPGCNLNKFRQDLLEHIKDSIENPTVSDNPVWDYNLKSELKDSKNEAKIEVGYKKKSIKSERHDYEFEFGITNQSPVAFKDIIAEIKFPVEYLEKRDWRYDHLHSNIVNKDGVEYIHFAFNYNGLDDRLRKGQYDTCLLPGHTVWVFGKENPLLITRLPYFVIHDNWDNRRKYRVEWKVFANGKLLAEGSMPFELLQMF